MSRKKMSFGAATGVVVAIVTAVWVAFSGEARSGESRYAAQSESLDRFTAPAAPDTRDFGTLDQFDAVIASGRDAMMGEGA